MASRTTTSQAPMKQFGIPNGNTPVRTVDSVESEVKEECVPIPGRDCASLWQSPETGQSQCAPQTNRDLELRVGVCLFVEIAHHPL